MNKFLTLIRRDLADNRGALLITPVVIAVIMLAITIMAALAGGARFGVNPEDFRTKFSTEFRGNIDVNGTKGTVTRGQDGRVIVTDENGNTHRIGGKPSAEDLKEIAPAVASATGLASLLPLAISGIAILFALAGSLHDERKDRTILFWKSLPVSDLQTVGAKMTSIVGVGLLFAFAVSVILHAATNTIAAITINQFTGLGVGTLLAALFGASFKLWVVLLCAMLLYIAWALPVFGWASMVSAWAPKVPFIAAFAPLIVVPLGYMAVAFRGGENDPILDALWDPAGRLIGEPVFTGVQSAISSRDPNIVFDQIMAHLGGNLAQPSLWIGLVLTAGFIYAASEIRRRRAL